MIRPNSWATSNLEGEGPRELRGESFEEGPRPTLLGSLIWATNRGTSSSMALAGQWMEALVDLMSMLKSMDGRGPLSFTSAQSM
jgi:hypothetical protein